LLRTAVSGEDEGLHVTTSLYHEAGEVSFLIDSGDERLPRDERRSPYAKRQVTCEPPPP
jgi:hypothetical protein